MKKSFLIITICYFIPNRTQNHCGKPTGSNEVRENRIVGGYDVGYYKYPWYVALINNKVVGCGGSLINSRTILTAAHCFLSNEQTKLEELYTVKLGIYNICLSEHTQAEFKVEKVKIHELYQKKNPYYDIAMIILAEDASRFTPICLPAHNIKNRPKEGLVPGLGVLKYAGATPCTVQESRLLIHPDSECRTMLEGIEKNVSHIIKAFCAGYIQGGVDTCQGDSGGPLQIIDKEGEYVLLGIVSFGYKCAAPGVLGLYTDVSQHLDWIKKHAVGHDHSSSEQNPSNSTLSPSSLSPTEIIIPQSPVTPPTNAPSIPLPSVGSKPFPSIQFYPMRPINRPGSNNSPINIFIFNRKYQKTKKKPKESLQNNPKHRIRRERTN